MYTYGPTCTPMDLMYTYGPTCTQVPRPYGLCGYEATVKTGQSIRFDLNVCGEFEFTMKGVGRGAGEEGGAQLKGPTTVATRCHSHACGFHPPG